MGADAWAVIGTVFFWGWATAFLAGVFCVFPSKGIFKPQQALLWGALLLLSGTLWVVSLLKAS